MRAVGIGSMMMLLVAQTATTTEGCGGSGDDLTDAQGYPIVDSGQLQCYDATGQVPCALDGEAFFGQDAQYEGAQPELIDNGDGTVTDNQTGLMWQQDPGNKMSFDEAVAGESDFDLAGHKDWRLPTIKELYSLIRFDGTDPSGADDNTTNLIPFIDDQFFAFEYGDPNAGERIIDSQFASSTEYVSETMDQHTMFGVNFADGRIKGYGTEPLPGQSEDKQFFVLYVRGNTAYGLNDFEDNDDGTITDLATGLMWTRDDSGGLGAVDNGALSWEASLAWAEGFEYAGYSDWRLPNAKELQSIVDYSRSPDTSGSAAIDPMFNATSIVNERGESDYPCYWTSTSHVNLMSAGSAAYVAFGRAMGYLDGQWQDVHGAGAQRSDPKVGDPGDYPQGHGPQGDAIRIFNYVRLVRGGADLNASAGEAGGQDGGAGEIGGDPSSGGEPTAGGEPPQEALDACVGQSEGVACSFESPDGTISGTCLQPPESDQLACVPQL